MHEGDWRLFSYDRETGKRVWHLDMGTHIIQRTDTPVDPIIEANREMMNNSTGQKFGDGKIVASIPLDIYYKHLGEATKNGDKKYIHKFLNDSDNAKWRTFGGRI